MAKQYKKTPILEKIKKARYKKGMHGNVIFALVTCVFVGFIICVAVGKAVCEQLIVFLLISACFIIYLIKRYIPPNNLNGIKKCLGVTHNEEVETILEKSEQLDDFIFLSGEYVIDFISGNVIHLNELQNVSSCALIGKRSSDFLCRSGVKLVMKDGSEEIMPFTEMVSCNAAAKKIAKAANFSGENENIR